MKRGTTCHDAIELSSEDEFIPRDKLLRDYSHESSSNESPDDSECETYTNKFIQYTEEWEEAERCNFRQKNIQYKMRGWNERDLTVHKYSPQFDINRLCSFMMNALFLLPKRETDDLKKRFAWLFERTHWYFEPRKLQIEAETNKYFRASHLPLDKLIYEGLDYSSIRGTTFMHVNDPDLQQWRRLLIQQFYFRRYDYEIPTVALEIFKYIFSIEVNFTEFNRGLMEHHCPKVDPGALVPYQKKIIHGMNCRKEWINTENWGLLNLGFPGYAEVLELVLKFFEEYFVDVWFLDKFKVQDVTVRGESLKDQYLFFTGFFRVSEFVRDFYFNKLFLGQLPRQICWLQCYNKFEGTRRIDDAFCKDF